MCSLSGDAVTKMWGHQFAVLLRLGIVEHPVLTSLRGGQTHGWGMELVLQWPQPVHRDRLTEMASLVQVSMMGCSRLSSSVMSSCVSSSSFWVCCSIARAIAALTCSYIERRKEHNVREYCKSSQQEVDSSRRWRHITHVCRTLYTGVLHHGLLMKPRPVVVYVEIALHADASSYERAWTLLRCLHILLALYLSECVQMLLLLLQIPLALLNELIDTGGSRWRNGRWSHHCNWMWRDVNHVFGSNVVEICKNKQRILLHR